MSYLSARRSPFPYHVKIGETGLLLGARGPNQPMLSSAKSQDISQVTPPDFSYAGMSPLGDRDEPYESLALGMGLRMQEKWQDFRYASARGVDLSVWPWCKGPQINLVTPPTRAAAGFIKFFELNSVLYCAQGRYILRRDDDTTWTMVKDFGAGVLVIGVAVFTSNFDGVQRAWVALSSGPAQYSSNGTTWTAMATFAALAFVAIGREFWWADDTNRLRKCDTNADPTNEANYTSLIFRAGDKSSPISALMVSAAGTLVIAKTDGLYTLDQAGDDHQLFPFLKYAPEAENGRNWGQLENSLYTAYGRSLLRLDADLSATDVGPEKLINNDSDVRGRITAFAGVGGMFAYAAIYNPDRGSSYLLKFGAYAEPGQAETTHLDAWHGAVSLEYAATTIRTLHVTTVGAGGDHTRTYLAFSDGTIGWLLNPCVPNPAACSAYRFAVGDAWVDLPLWHGGYHASPKSLRHVSVTGPRLDAANYVTLEYKLEPAAASWTTFPNVFDHSTYETAMLPNDATTVLASFRVHLVNTAATASPLVSAVSIGHALRPPRYMTVELMILCADGLVRRDGVPLRIGRRQIQRVVEAAVDTAGTVTCTLPDETVQELSFTDYSISQSFDEVGRQWRGSLTVKAIQHHPVTTEV